MTTHFAVRAVGAALAVLLATTMAAAHPGEPAHGPAPAPGTEAARDARLDAAGDAASDRRRYCIERPRTGTILTRPICKTRAQWARIGIEIPRQ
ncbi:hypothetical protein RCO27_17185 [Sphingosinicella sp. LHD-64]|uniref:hypothetical protein n=1 Tax=Sphingosinicella sp. LHD-64 TaxID=3072139 RepID=UPI0028109333|nr:hypothetical protein [Sphingosinicella sp. LHD-64]MDQ8757962.1 hypothetical protein [Sphingosinicella sp. LHD-64]